ncbi:MAG: signal recognition particle-docking protein FtsY [Peptoniphilus sp.]|nr:signal recognition particle-docking protein FtsY [Peptoniphilus sp.]MDY3119211.1 signal recognition particle-docking protein FtsY [Peptoniphilus sp.]
MLEWFKRKISKQEEKAEDELKEVHRDVDSTESEQEGKAEPSTSDAIEEGAFEEPSESSTTEEEHNEEEEQIRHKAYDFSASGKERGSIKSGMEADSNDELIAEEEVSEDVEDEIGEEGFENFGDVVSRKFAPVEETTSSESMKDTTVAQEEMEIFDPEESPEPPEGKEDSHEPEKADKSEEKVGWFQRLKQGLEKTRDDMNFKINDILGNYVKIDDDMLEDLEDLLISSDIGMETTMTLIDRLKERIRERQIQDPKLVKGLLAEEIRVMLEEDPSRNRLNVEPSPAIILIVGVNGVGKTTTIGKLAYRFKNEGKSVLIAAADTFRAAAIEQIETWGERSGTPVISHKEGADPAAVVFDAIQAQKSRGIDVLICDTAGRLHNKKNLMNELEKIHRIIEKEAPNAQKESLLVLDATTGQNAILQAKTFDEVTDLSGIILTKLDGTAKGGVVLPLVQELDIPIKLIGVGESMLDLQDFSGKDFANALISAE